MQITFRRPIRLPRTWEDFRREVRKVDRDSLLIQAATATARMEREGPSDEEKKLGFLPWTIADVARTAIVWAGFERPLTDRRSLQRLCNMNFHLIDEEAPSDPGSDGRLGRILSRLYFEQFPPQLGVMSGVSRTLLLFGSAVEFAPGFSPEAMAPGWFEQVTNGISLDDYVGAIFLISLMTQMNAGRFDPHWFDNPRFQELSDVLPLSAAQRIFAETLLTTIDDFKIKNRAAQDPANSAEKKYAFNPLHDTPFIGGVDEIPIAPFVRAIIAKASPVAVYHQAREALGDAFTRDLGSVFQHYVGRNLALVGAGCDVIPEVRYGPKNNSVDSCDWFLDLPGLVVLIECKARQPIESLRRGGDDWLSSVQGSIGKGISQLNRSHSSISQISSVEPQLDSSKPRVGIVVTLGPFYVSQNWPIWDHLPHSDLPTGVLSASELESLVLLDTGELERELMNAARDARGNRMLLSGALNAAADRENPLLSSTWESIGVFAQAEEAARSMRGGE